MDPQLKIQYTVVAIIIMAAIVWIAVRFWRNCKRKNKLSGGCSCCALAESCKKPAKDITKSHS